MVIARGSASLTAIRRFLVCVVCICLTVAVMPRAASAEELSSSLAISGFSPTEAEQRKAEEEARYDSPEAVKGREESENEWMDLSAAEAQGLTERLMPRLVNEPDGGPPKLPEGVSGTGFPGDFAESVLFPGGVHGVIDSLAPLAVQTSSGRVPIDLTPHSAGQGFEAVTPAQGLRVRVGGRLSEGASLLDLGITMTPVTQADAPFDVAGKIAGASVFYGNSEDAQAGVRDMDTLAKINVDGMSLETILRSRRSPEDLYFKVGLPEDAKLVQEGAGPIRILEEGRQIASVLAPAARDAEGNVVPIQVSIVSPNMVKLNVPHPTGRYRFPIAVDPYTYDEHLVDEASGESNWHVYSPYWSAASFREYACCNGGPYVEDLYEGSHGAGWWGAFAYETQGISRIQSFDAYIFSSVTPFGYEAQHENRMKIESKSGAVEAERSIPGYFNEERTGTPCGVETCQSIGSAENHAEFEQVFFKEGSDGLRAIMDRPEVLIIQETGPSVGVDATESTTQGLEPLTGKEIVALNAGTGQWVNPVKSGAVVAMNASDPGIGVYRTDLRSTQELNTTEVTNPYWSYTGRLPNCKGVQCPRERRLLFSLSTGCSKGGICSWLPEGEDTVTASVENATGLYNSEWSSGTTATVRIDEASPHNITLSGLGPGGQVGAGEYHLKAEATDGSGTVKSSGVKSLALYIDGKQVGNTAGSCPVGPCTAKAEWRIFGHEYATGQHTLAVVATDNAGNTSTGSFSMSVHPAEPVALGPGMVNLQSGELSLGTTDVSMPGGLTVSRNYASEHLTAGTGGPLGAQWGFSLGGQESLVKQPDGSMVLTGATGGQTIFTSDGKGGYVSPAGDSNLKLSETTTECEPNRSEFMLRNEAAVTTTCFAVPSGGTSGVWMPHINKGAVATDTVTYSYETKETPTGSGQKITRPHEALAPIPAGVGSCSPEIKAGCHALKFNYAEKTTASGEGPSETEWGDVEGLLTRVYYVVWDPASKAKKEIEVAHYLYDKKGKLRAEWDPRLESSTDCGGSCPALKTYYGYDGEGHVTAVTPAGQESWALVYGQIAGSTSPAAIKATLAPASAPIWKGEGLINTERPKLSGTPAVGVRMAVSNGAWTNNPVVYGYQWEDCNSNGGSCTAISGATNANYTPVSGDIGHTMVAVVTAVNGGGSVQASTSVSGVVASKPGSYTQTVDSGYKLSAVSCIPGTSTCVVSDSAGKALYATNTSASSSSTWNSWSGPGTSPSQAVDCPATSLCVMSAGEKGKAGIYYATALGGAWTLGYAHNTLNPWDAVSCASTSFCVAGETTERWIAYSTNPASTAWKEKSVGGGAGSITGIDCLSSSFCAAVDTTGHVHVTTTGVEGVWMETDVDGTSTLNSVACLSVSSCMAVDNAGNELTIKIESNGAAVASKHTIAPFYSLTGVACPGSATCVATDTSGRIFLTTNSGETWTTLYSLGSNLTAVSCASATLCVATNTGGGVTAFNLTGTGSEGEAHAAQPGSTVEYGVPVSGSGAPYAMGAKEVEEGWGQKDLPSGATAVFPPDSPQGWPASSYTRATVYYRDSTERTVNVATPGGGISTSEYTASNDVERTLSATNRAIALKEASPVEAAKRLDTQSTYNSEGTELLSTLGPRHMVRLTNGKEVLARSHTVYSYDEGHPTGGPYRLVTKATQGAQIEGEAEQDIRTTLTSYSGQENLGWKLRVPTSTTIDPNGLKLIHTTVYDPATGHVTETRAPASKGSGDTHDTMTVYYTTASNSTYPTCGGHPEWANLPCETLPGKQPETLGLPSLPATIVMQYNNFGQPTETVSTVTQCVKVTSGTGKYTNSGCTSAGSGEYELKTSKRTTLIGYDAAGRAETSETTSTIGKTLPKVTNKYSTSTGALIEQSTTSEGVTQTVKSTLNTLGLMTAYTDADGNTSTFEYEGEGAYQGSKEKDLRLRHTNDGQGSTEYTYNQTTGTVSKLTDTQGVHVLTFEAAYDVEGTMTSETYPNGMTASYTRNPAGETTGLEYVKTSNCSSSCTWFADTAVPSIHGQWMTQASTLSAETYTYNQAGWLTQTLENTNEGCTTRIYALDNEANRTSLTTRKPAEGGACATEGGTSETHTYDPASRLTDPGAAYEPFGETSKLPAADAGGSELQTSFYTDGRAYEQSQNGQWLRYELDPTGRIRRTIDTGAVNSTYTSHYTGPGDSPAWTTEDVSGHWTRYVQGISGFAAIETDTAEPTLQLQDLQGNIIGSASLSETATKLLSTERPTEYGVPSGNKPEKYSWLGGNMTATELPSGVAEMGVRSYIPQIGRFLQSDPVEGGSANAYAYTYGNPVNETDPSGALTWGFSEGEMAGAEATAAQAVEEYNARVAAEQAAAEEAERKALEESAAAAQDNATPSEGGGPTAHIAVAGVVTSECYTRVDNPHRSKHVRGTVNVVAHFICDDTMYNVRMRVALFRNHKVVSESGYVSKGNVIIASQNAAASCSGGIYQGWVEVTWDIPPEFEPPLDRKKELWGKAVIIKC